MISFIIGFILGLIVGFIVAAILRAKLVSDDEDYYAEEPFSSVYDEEY